MSPFRKLIKYPAFDLTNAEIPRDSKVPEQGQHSYPLRRSKKNRNVLVKRLIISGPDGGYYNFHSNYTEQQFKDHYQKSLRLLERHLGKYLPNLQLVYSHDEKGEGTGFMVIDEVLEDKDWWKDKDEDKSKKFNNAKREQLSEMLIDFINMWIDEVTNRACGLVPEIDKKGNILYGHTKKQPATKVYIIDTYPVVECNKEDVRKLVTKAWYNNTSGALPPKLQEALQRSQDLNLSK